MKIKEHYLTYFTPIKFDSTKNLYSYAKNKIITIAKEQNKEYAIIADTKDNRILFEKLGDKHNVDISEFKFPKRDNITVMHGHVTKSASPLSLADCINLCEHDYEKIIAFNTRGKFSILSKTKNSNIKQAKSFFKYGILFQEYPFKPKSFFKKIIFEYFANSNKIYEKWIKYFCEQPNINFKYFSTMLK